MRILLAHMDKSPDWTKWFRGMADCAPADIDVRAFPLNLPGPDGQIDWPELHAAWRNRQPGVLRAYARLREAAEDRDVLMLFHGANLHPGFLEYLPTFNVFCCWDDPESSEKLGKSIAHEFDAVFHGNIASRLQYESWGCRRIAHLPLLTLPEEVPPPAERDAILHGERTNDIIFCCGQTRWRRARPHALAAAFPDAKYSGRGSPGGWISMDDMHRLYRTSRIGWNVHNTTGPINQRAFDLAAFGVMQICDNRTGLGHLFRLGEEAIGFDTIPEAIDVTRYFLAHDAERRSIAARGYDRYWRDYHAEAIWRRVVSQIEQWQGRRLEHVPSVSDLEPAPATRLLLMTRHAADRIRLRGRRMLNKAIRRHNRRRRPFATHVDERFYLGIDVPFRDRGNRVLTLIRPPATATDPDRIEHRRHTLAWAATAFIRGARSILVVGRDDGFTALAALEPGRHVLVMQPGDSASGPTCDLVVCLQAESILGDDAAAAMLPCLAGRAIVAAPAASDHANPNARRLHRRLSLYYRRVRLYHLPDPYVPWLEPMEYPIAAASIIAECTKPLMTDDDLSAADDPPAAM